jgi:OOP family OmpA-OmpF porin
MDARSLAMRVPRDLFALCVLATAIGVAQPVHAEGSGGYLFGSVGQSKYDSVDIGGGMTVCDIFDPGSSCSESNTGTGLKIGGGYRFNPYLAVEGAYAYLGEAKASGSGTILGAPAAGEVKWTAGAIKAAAVGIIPIGNAFSVRGNIGFAFWNMDYSVSGLGGSDSDSDNGTSLTYGVGAQWDFMKNLGVRLEWERFNDVGSTDVTGQANVDLWSVGVVWSF